MRCFNCKSEMAIGNGGNWNCPKCKILINMLNLSHIDQEKAILNSYKCIPHDWEISPSGGECKNCDDYWLYER